MRREGDAAGWGRAHAPEPPRHHGTQAVGADHDARPIRFPFPASRIPRYDTADGLALVHQVLDLHTLLDYGSRRFRGAAQDRVKGRARQGEAEAPTDESD